MKRAFLASTERPKDVASYIRAASPEARARLKELRSCLRQAAPAAKESLKWGVPALSERRILFTYAAFKQHVSLFPTPAIIRAFAGQLKGLKTSASTIQFPLDRPLPLRLIRSIALARVRACREQDARWM